MASPFEENYPSIDRWVNDHDGWIELGYVVDSPSNSFVRALDMGGMPWEGRNSYASVDEALQELEDALTEILRELYGE
jgi:hypothetical protein